MAVDTVTKIEKVKMKYTEDDTGYIFPRWLAYLIGMQMMWTKLKHSQKEKVNALEYLYEERMWYIAAA